MRKIISFALAIVMLLAVVPFSLFTVSAGDLSGDATPILLGTQCNGVITETNDKDIYSFELETSGSINIKLNAYIYRTNYYLYDSDGNEIWSYTDQYWNGNTGKYTMDATIHLTKGVYYFAVCKRDGTGNYDFSISFTGAEESFTETGYGSNNSIADANAVELNKGYKGQIAKNDDKDVYSFTLESPASITIKLNAYISETDFHLYDSNGTELWKSIYGGWNNSGVQSLTQDFILSEGTYYFAVHRDIGAGNYNFTVGCGVMYDIAVNIQKDVEVLGDSVFDGGTTVKVTEVEIGEIHDTVTNYFEKIMAYDFSAVANGEAVQPRESVRVNFSIPDKFSDNVSVYYVDQEGVMEKANSFVDKANRKVCADLMHFSTYILVDNESADGIIGDINESGEIDSLDYILLKRAFFGTYSLSDTAKVLGDINGNGEIDSLDYILLKRAFFGTYQIS